MVALDADPSPNELRDAQAALERYAAMVETPEVAEAVIAGLSLDATPEDLLGRVSTDTSGDSLLLTIRARDDVPRPARDVVQALGDEVERRVFEALATDDTERLRSSVRRTERLIADLDSRQQQMWERPNRTSEEQHELEELRAERARLEEVRWQTERQMRQSVPNRLEWFQGPIIPQHPIGDEPGSPGAMIDQLESMAWGELTLLVEPVAERVARVLSDGTGRDLDQPIMDVGVSTDGAVVVATERGIVELDSSDAAARPRGTPRFVARVDVAPDGTLLVRGGGRRNERDMMAFFDGQRWTVLPKIPTRYRTAAPDAYDPHLAGDGSLWVGTQRGLARYADRTWTHVPWKSFAPRAAARRTIGFGVGRSLDSTAEGDLWVGVGHTLSRYHDGAWTEFEPLASHLDDVRGDMAADTLDLAIGAEGTLWGLTSIRAEDAEVSGLFLVRRRADDWSVHRLDDVVRDSSLHSERIAADDDGAVLLLAGPRPRDVERRPDEIRLVRFDGVTVQELARLPGGRRYRIADVGPEDAVWLIGGTRDGREADRLHLVAGARSGAAHVAAGSEVGETDPSSR
jgi:hypothetical protein